MAKKTNAGGGLSLRTKDATKGGGVEGALATITEIGCVDEFTYGGRQKDKPQAALRVVYEIEGFDKPWEQHHSFGPSNKFEVIEDGDGIRSVGKQTGLNEKSSAFAFFTAVEEAAAEAGLDLDELIPALDGGGNSVRPLEGRRVRLTNVKFETVGGDTKDLPVIGAFVEEDEAPARGKGKTSKKAPGGGDVEATAEEWISALLEDGPVKKGDLSNDIFQAHKKDADVKAVMNLCFKDAFIASEDRPWNFDKKKGVLSAAE